MAKYIFRAGKLTVYVLMPLLIAVLIVWAFCHNTYAQLSNETSEYSSLALLAQEYSDSGQYQEAEQIWLSLTRQDSDLDLRKEATESLILFYADSGQDPNALDMLSSYIATYSEDDTMAVTIEKTAEIYQQRKQYTVAKDLYKYVSQKWPGTDQAMYSLAGQALTEVNLHNDPNATQIITTLISEYAENPKLTDTLCHLGEKYCEQSHYQQALELYQTLDQEVAGDDYQVILDIVGAVISEIIYGCDPNESHNPNGVNIISELATVYSTSPNLDLALSQAASIYFSEAVKTISHPRQQQCNLYQAIEIFELTMESAATPEMSATACYQLAECHRLLGQENSAINYYDLVASNWPDYAYAWNAQFMIGRCSEKLLRKGLMDTFTAESNCVQAYTEVCREYPRCPAEKAASNWLKSHGIINQ